MIVFYLAQNVESYVTPERYRIYVGYTDSTIRRSWQAMRRPNECILLAPPTVGPHMWDVE